MEKKDQTDYVAAYREYCNYSKPNQSMKSFCEEQNYNYGKFRRYVDKAFWTEPKAKRDSIGCQCIPVEVEKPEEPSRTEENVQANKFNDDNPYSIISINVEFVNGLRLSMGDTSVDDIVKLLNKLTV